MQDQPLPSSSVLTELAMLLPLLADIYIYMPLLADRHHDVHDDIYGDMHGDHAWPMQNVYL
jgi:hypothetical protein